MRRAILILSAMVLILASAHPATAGCVSCGPGGECYDASPGFSANCECRIRSINGAVICKPSGICDPTDANTCSEDPWVTITPGSEISTRFINRLAERNPLLAGAIWGAIVEEDSPDRKDTRLAWIRAGESTGTMGKGGRSYTFLTEVRQTAGNVFSLSIRLEEDGTGRVEEFEGVLLEGGRTGNLARVGREGKPRVFSWNARERQR